MRLPSEDVARGELPGDDIAGAEEDGALGVERVGAVTENLAPTAGLADQDTLKFLHGRWRMIGRSDT